MAKDIFGPYWSLVFLGALAEADPPFDSFDVALRRHAGRVAPARQALLRRVRDLGLFDEIVLDLAETDSLWAAEPREPSAFDPEMLAGLLSLACSAGDERAWVHLGSRADNLVSCREAARRELARLLSAFIAAAWVADISEPDVAAACDGLLADAMELLGDPFLPIAPSSVPLEEIVDATYDDAAPYKAWVRSVGRMLRARTFNRG